MCLLKHTHTRTHTSNTVSQHQNGTAQMRCNCSTHEMFLNGTRLNATRQKLQHVWTSAAFWLPAYSTPEKLCYPLSPSLAPPSPSTSSSLPEQPRPLVPDPPPPSPLPYSLPLHLLKVQISGSLGEKADGCLFRRCGLTKPTCANTGAKAQLERIACVVNECNLT